MITTTVNNYIIKWLQNPKDIKKIEWKDINKCCEETINFEPDGDGKTKYVYGCRRTDNKFIKVAKAVKNFVFLPFLFGSTQFIMMINFLYQNESLVSIFCMYAIMLLIFSHYLFSMETNDVISSDKRTC